MTRTARARRTPDRGTARQSEGAAGAASSTETSTQPTATGDNRARRFWRSFLHDRSVRSRIAALIIIPLVATLVFGVLFVLNSVQRAQAADDVEQLANVGLAANTLAHRVQDERDTTALTDGGITGTEALTEARAKTDESVSEVNGLLDDVRDSGLADVVSGLVAEYDQEIDRLGAYRDMADRELAPFDRSAAIVYNRLSEAVVGIVTIAGEAADDPDTARRVTALGDISAATSSASYERGLFVFYLKEGEAPSAEQQRESAVFREEQDLFLDKFLESFSFRERRPFANDIIRGSRGASAVRASIAAGLPTRTTKEAWYQASTVRIDAFREIERQLGAQIATRAEQTSTQAWTRAGISAAAVLAVMALTLALATYVARSIVGPLGRLREAARETASRGLPGLVDRIRQDGPAVARTTSLAITPEGKDEIGQVANAFNDVQETAVQVAADQALLRQNLDTIVVNLSRRTQSLIDRQLGEIEGLEARERDPEQLSTLFRIDHMATRVRRHAESLLVLAGVDEMRKHGAATPVLDVVRTAVGEVEQYPRVKFGVMPTDLVASVGVDDVAHLLAELIDNATEFSSPSTPVTITSQPLLGGGLRIQVTDIGLGVPPEQLTALNERLGNPGDIDVAASRTLGLYVVARLANKHGIRVRMEPGPTAGIVAQVDLPAHLILSPLDTTEGVIPPVTDATGEQPVVTDGSTPSLLDTEGAGIDAETGLPRRMPADLPRRGTPEPAQANGDRSTVESIWNAPRPPVPPLGPPSTPIPPPSSQPSDQPSGRPAPGAPIPASAIEPITPLVGPGRERHAASASTPDPAPQEPQQSRPVERPQAPAPATASADSTSSADTPFGSGLYDGPGTQEHPIVPGIAANDSGPSTRDDPLTGERPITPERERPAAQYQAPATRPAPAARPSVQPAPSNRPPSVRPTPSVRSTPSVRPAPSSRPAPSGRPAPSARPVTAHDVVDQSLRAPTPALPSADAPIYEAVRSAWFSDGGPNRDFSSPADAGWRRAAEALRSAEEAATARRSQHREVHGDSGPIRSTRPARPDITRRAPAAAAPSAPSSESLLDTTRPIAASNGSSQGRDAVRPEAPAASWTSGGQPGPAADEPILGPTGLPMRRRGASLVPGSIADATPETAATPAPAARKDAGSVASTLSSLQRGVSRGRDEGGGWVPTRPSDAERSNP